MTKDDAQSACQHPHAVATGLMDTTWQTYLMWECPDCGAGGNLPITREKYVEIVAIMCEGETQ